MTGRIAPARDMSLDYLKKPYKLLRPGADATVTDEHGNGAVHYLVQSDIFKTRSPDSSPDDSVFGRRLRRPSPVDDPSMTMEGLTRSLRAAGADINLQNKSGETPLHFLCGRARAGKQLDPTLCEILCQAGADLNIGDRQGRSPVFSFFLNGRLDSWQRDQGEDLCQLVSRLGGRFDVRDNHGRTVIHALFSCGADIQSSVQALARHGVDPCAVDDEGNTLWHAAIDRLDPLSLPQGDKKIMDLLLRLGVDPQKPNKLGRSPLHGLSSRQAPCLKGRMTVFPACIPDLKTTAFDNLLKLYLERGYNLDIRDTRGITPLHLACTFSEYQVVRLLEAGADLKIPTHEQLTPFHIAARCGQANIIGVLLGKAKEHGSGQDGQSSSFIYEAINAKDAFGRSPLYYACICGSPESVALLLDAGATVQTDEYTGSVWQACVEFEEEQSNWSSSIPARDGRMTASSVLIEDKKRPMPETANTVPRQHLGDVLRLLLQRQDDSGTTRGYLEKAISAAAAQELDYTVWCLVEARKSLDLSSELGTAGFTPDETVSACLDKCAAQSIDEAATLSSQGLRAEFDRLMGLRRLDLVQGLLLEHGWGEIGWDVITFIHDLVRNGFVSVLRVLTPLVRELSANLEDMEWCARQKPMSPSRTNGRSYAKWCAQPLLLVACQSKEPNMEMVRFLVEEIGCSVNAQGYVRIRVPDSPTRYGLCRDESPIHALVRGNTNWWHTSQALPYLARDRGAKLEIQDAFQSTPLVVAASHAGRVTFKRAAVQMLLDFGANAQAVDLTLTCDSAEATRLLLSKGAAVKPAAILSAIRSGNCDVLNVLLSGGGDVNARETDVPKTHQRQDTPIYVATAPPPRELWPIRTEFEQRLEGVPPVPSRDKQNPTTPGPFVPEEHMYPLDYAAHLYSRQPELDEVWRPRDMADDAYRQDLSCAWELPADELEKVIETLVARGADVTATYTFPDGASISIKDRIVLRARDYNMPWLKMERPRRAKRILELCQTTYEGDL